MIKPNEWFAELYYSEGLVESSEDPHLLLTSGGWEGVVAIWINTPAGSSPRFQRNPALDALLRSCCASEPVHREPNYSKYQPTEIYECKDVSFYHIDPDDLRLADKVEQQEDGTYHLPFDTSVFIDFYDGKGLKPARAYFMQEGTSQARELFYANPQWPQMPLALRLTFTEDETEGKLWFVFDRGDGTCVRTEPISIVIERATSVKRFMTLEDVYALARKGEDLRYSDLEPFICVSEEQSGGTAVMIYPIGADSDRDFHLMFRGNIYEQPTNVLLAAGGFGLADIRYVDPEQFVKKAVRSKDVVMPHLQESNSNSLLLANEFMNNAALARSREAEGAYLIRGQVLTGFAEIELGEKAREAGLQLYQIAYRLCPDHPERVRESEDLWIEDGWITEQTDRGAPCVLYCSGQEGTELLPFVNLARGDLILWTKELEGKDLDQLCLDTWQSWREQIG